MGREGRGPVWILLGLLPLLGLGVLLAYIVLNGAGRQDAPPVEDLSVQRVALPTESEFVLTVRNGGTQPVKLSQVVRRRSGTSRRSRTARSRVWARRR